MKKTIITFVLLLITSISYTQNLYPNLFDNSGGITNGYGAWGSNNYVIEASIDVPDKGVITFYHPDMAAQQKPTIIFISGWGQDHNTYDKYFKYITSLGYPVINIYNYSPGSINTSYQNSVDMIEQAVSTYATWIDTSKIGLAGHSYGAGSTIWVGKQLFDSNGLNWGTNGRFIMMFAPWYPFLITDTELQNYPSDVKLAVIQSYDELNSSDDYDYLTDPRVIRAMYQLISIPDTDKDCITVFSDQDATHNYTYNGTTFSYLANHYISYTDLVSGNNNPYDRLDVYLMNRLTNAMTEYVFEGDDVVAKEVILGNGSANQIAMDILPNLAVTDKYITVRPESDFEYKCTADAATWADPAIWKLYNYCEDNNNNGVIDVLNLYENTLNSFNIYPIPANDFLVIQLKNENLHIFNYEIYSILGKKIQSQKLPVNNRISIKHLPKGTYFLKIKTEKNIDVQKFIVD
jgi:pimeloyl-ACP methyl ester carboxylesterase